MAGRLFCITSQLAKFSNRAPSTMCLKTSGRVQDRGSEPWWFRDLRQKHSTPLLLRQLINNPPFFQLCWRLLMTLVISEMSCRTSLVTAEGVGHTVWDCFWLSLTLHHAAPHKPQMSFSIQSYSPFSEERRLGQNLDSFIKKVEDPTIFMMSYSAHSR